MKIIVLASYANSLLNFRQELLEALVSKGHHVTACAPEKNEYVKEKLNSLNIEYRPLPLERTGMNPIKDAKTFLRLISFFKEIKPDMLISYTIKPVIYGSLAARLAGITNIYSIITGLGFAFEGGTKKRKLLRLLVKVLYKVSLSTNTKVFFQNPDDLQLFKNLGIIKPGQEILINGSGVNLHKYQEAAPLINPPTYLLIGRLLKEKGVGEYAEAAKQLKKRYPSAVFRLLGPFDENPSSFQADQVNEWHKSGVIDYLGKTRDVRPYIAAAGVYVLPSYREGTPRSVLEAMAMGRPIITTDVPGCRETINMGRNGFLVPVRDTKALINAMEKFILDPSLIPAMGRQSRIYVEERYDVHNVNKNILDAMCL